MENKKMGYIYAPHSLVKEKKKVRFMYREKPDNDQDSGWRVFSGDEDQSYIDNPDNMGIYSAEEIVKVDPDIQKYLDMPLGTAFEREDSHKDFVKSSQFDFEPEK